MSAAGSTASRAAAGRQSILALDGVSYRYGRGGGGLSDVTFEVGAGEAVGVVGESGAGKTTLLRVLLGLVPPTAGSVLVGGAPLQLNDRALRREFRRSVQPVFQDPYSSLDPRQRVDSIVGEPLRSLGIARGAEAARAAAEALDSVGLPSSALRRYPHEFSGGQRQRIAIARAIVARPRLLLADEPVSALDMTTRIQVLELFRRLREERGLALVFVSHDLAAVAALCERTVVLRDGRIVEQGETLQLLRTPAEDYTRRLVSAVPRLPTE